MIPIANDLISIEKFDKPETNYPLRVMTCSNCALVQLPEVASRESLFRSDYVYFSSYSSTWLEHAQNYVAKMIELLKLSSNDLVIEIASNDGYLLQYFNQEEIQVLGVEPSHGVAQVAIEKGIDTIIDFFGSDLAAKLSLRKKPKLILGNNVLAHVPDLHDFIEGFALLIDEEGLITFEFPHLISLIKNNQFDTIYHEHYSYLSVTALSPVFKSHNLKVVRVEKLKTHGGSIRIYVAKNDSSWKVEESVKDVLLEESESDPRKQQVWRLMQEKTLNVKENLIRELNYCKTNGIKVAAYGAAAKGVTLLNFSRITSEHIEYVIDLNPHKQGKFLPGSKIPIVGLNELKSNPPQVLLVLPWNLADEVKSQLSTEVREGLKLLKAIPSLEYF
jgi:hypothetical protein